MGASRATEWSQISGWAGLAKYSKREQLLTAFFSAANVGLAIVDTQLKYQVVNDALAEMNGIPAEAHLGKSVRDVLGSAAKHIEPILYRVLLTGEPVLNAALTAQLPTRTEVGHWVMHYFPMNETSGKQKGIGVVVVEVTKQKELEEKFFSLVGKLQQKKESLEMLLEISTTLTSNADLRGAFPLISASIRKVMQQNWTNLSILGKSAESMRMYVSDFPPAQGLIAADTLIPLRETASGLAVSEGRPRIFNHAELTAIQSSFIDQLLRNGIKSACCVPLVTPRGTIGSFNLASTEENAFHSEDIDLLKQIGALLATALDNNRAHSEIADLSGRLRKDSLYAREEKHSEPDVKEIVGQSPALAKVFHRAKTVAPSDSTVLILGETGTGKELIARAIHRMSLRKAASFIKLNCAAIPAGLLESELFGYERGAFTGAASRKIGLLELADQGTLFLDEVGDLPWESQPKLLRVLQDGEFERLGSTRTIHVNIRLLAATNLDLAGSVAERKFRADLYYRLSVFPICMPALRERVQDIPLLVRYFAEKYARKMNKPMATITVEAMHALASWQWPGNVRELEHFVERSVILTEGSVLNLPLAELQSDGSQPPLTFEAMGREYILRALRETGGLIAGAHGAAALLGMKLESLQSTMQRLRIPWKDYRN
jgi:formate hydrogenlyase transcriptional activator